MCSPDAWSSGSRSSPIGARWKDRFGATYDLRLSDLIRAYLEGEMEQAPKAQYGWHQDKRPACCPVVLAVVASPEGFPLVFEVRIGSPRAR